MRQIPPATQNGPEPNFSDWSFPMPLILPCLQPMFQNNG
jgi:hypothetical protein